MNNNSLIELIKTSITDKVMLQHDLTVEKIIKDTEATISMFEIKEKSREEVFMQEIPYYIAFGMTAFDSGYLGKSL